MLPKLQNSNSGGGDHTVVFDAGKINKTALKSFEKMAKAQGLLQETKIKPVNSKKAIAKTLKETKQKLSSISDFPAFFDFLQKENSSYHEEMEDMERNNNELRANRHNEIMDVILTATKNKTMAEKSIVKKKMKKVEEPKAETKPAGKTEPKAETKTETKATTPPKTESKVETKPTTQSKTEPKVEPKVETKPTPKVEQPKVETAKPVTQPTTPPPAATTAKPAVEVPKATPTAKPVVEAAKETAKIVAPAAVAVATGSALAKIKEHEKFSATAYPDPEKNPDGSIKRKLFSVGYGHQITEKEVQQGYIQVGDTRVPVLGDLGKDTILTKQQADILVAQDFSKYENSAKAIPNFDKLNPAAQDALIDITYNMGVGWTKKFPSFVKAMSNMELEKAAEQLLYADSTKTKKTGYYTQVKGRAEENAKKIAKGSLGVTPEQIQSPEIGNKIMDMSTDNAEMKKLMRQQAASTTIIQVNNNSTQRKVVQLPENKTRELNPTMQ